MVGLSQTTGYAILALTCLKTSIDDWILVKDISVCSGVPLPYLSKIMFDLSKKGLVESKRGYQGGFKLTRPAVEISLLDVTEAVDGPDWCAKCLLGIHNCSGTRQCPVHGFWLAERERIRKLLSRVTLADLGEVAEKDLPGCCPSISGCSDCK